MKRFLLHILPLLAAALLLPWMTAMAQDTRAQEKKKARLQQEIKKINGQLKENQAKRSSELTNLTLLKKKISTRAAIIAENEAEIASLNDSIALTGQHIRALNARLDTLTACYDKTVLTAYKNRDARVWYLYIFGSKNISQGIRRAAYLKRISRSLNENAVAIKETRAQLEEEKARLESLSETARQRKNENEAEVSTLRKEQAQSEQVIARLQQDKKKYTDQLEKKNKEVAALNREIAALIKKAAERAAAKAAEKAAKEKAGKAPDKTPTTGKTVSTDANPALSGQFAANKGRLPWPVDGAVLESFGQHYHPVYKNVQLPYNNGVTVSTKAGAPVKAVFDGEVTQVIVMPGYNQCVLVQHGKYFTFYCCLTGATVKRGDKVKTGQTLGSVCTIDDESKMHFELWQDRTPQNPELWLK